MAGELANSVNILPFGNPILGSMGIDKNKIRFAFDRRSLYRGGMITGAPPSTKMNVTLLGKSIGYAIERVSRCY